MMAVLFVAGTPRTSEAWRRSCLLSLASLLDAVTDRRGHAVVTRDGSPAAALVPVDEYEALDEIAEILSTPK